MHEVGQRGPKGTVAQEEETPRSGVKGFREKRAGLWEEETQCGRSTFAEVIPAPPTPSWAHMEKRGSLRKVEGWEGPLRPSEGLSGLGLAAGWREELEGMCVPRHPVRKQRSYK